MYRKTTKLSNSRTKAKTQKKSTKVKRAPKRCNYCRNHTSEIVLEKGHGTCIYNNLKHFDNCKKCKMNFKKTEIARKHRDEKLTKCVSKVGRRKRLESADKSLENLDENKIVETVMEIEQDFNKNNNDYCSDILFNTNDLIYLPISPSNDGSDFDSLISTANSINYDNDSDYNQPQKFGTSLIILPTTYPNDIFFPKDAHDMEKLIENVSDELERNGNEKLKIPFKSLECGRWKVTCLNSFTSDKLIKLVSQWSIKTCNLNYIKLEVIPEDKLPKYIQVSCILDHSITKDEFFTTIASSSSLNTSRWTVYRIDSIGNQFRVYFGIDPLSYRYLSINQFYLFIKNKDVKVQIESNPFARNNPMELME